MRASTVTSVVAALAVVVGAVLIGAVVVVRTAMLDPTTYTSALVTTDAYDRIYTEVLADPELAGLKEELLGDLGIPAALAPQARSLATNVLRWTVPPSMVRQLSERTIQSTIAYVRGDTPRLQADVAVDAIAARVPDATVREVRTLLAGAAERTVENTDQLRDAMRDLGDLLAAGEVPAEIPKIGGESFDPTAVAEAVLDGLGDRVDDDARTRVLAAVLAQDERDAIIDAAALVVADHAGAAAERLGAEPTVDLVALTAEHAERPVDQLVATFDRVRDLARWTGPWTAVAGGMLMIGGLAVLWARHRRGPGRFARWAGSALVIGGGLAIAGWLVARAAVRSPLAALSEPGADGWSLPPATGVLLGDVAREVGTRISAVAWRYGLVLVLAGVLLAGGSALWRAIRTPGARRLAVAGLAVAGLVAFSAIVGSRPRDMRACNGASELCDRPYDEVTTAATHNSMSSPDVVPVWPEHDGGITEQLDAGVRTLLIDILHWEPIESAGQLTEIETPGEPSLPPQLAEALLRNVVAVRDGRPGAFLCHIHCSFGAQPLAEGLAEIAAFMAANPDEVVTLIIQDEIPAAEVTAAFEDSELVELVHTQRPDRPWPTLGQLIDDGERLVVFAENEGPPPDWYANAFESMQETPFLFLSSDDFSCVENRGRSDTSLFLMNHWIQRIAPDRADATEVNRLDVLVDRARQCADERGLVPNFLAVNFYNIGDVVEAAAVLNGVGADN